MFMSQDLAALLDIVSSIENYFHNSTYTVSPMGHKMSQVRNSSLGRFCGSDVPFLH